MKNEEITHYQYLDKIIHKLFESIERQVPQDDMREEFVTKEFKETPDSEQAYINLIEAEFNEAINYLKSLGLIVESFYSFDNSKSTYKLTFLGRIKHSRTFVDEYWDEKIRRSVVKWQRRGIWTAVGFSIFSLFISLYDHFYKSSAKMAHKTYNKCYNTYNYCEQSKPSIESVFSVKKHGNKRTIINPSTDSVK